MNSSNFMIGPIKDGVRTDLRPFAIPEDAFESLTNAYQYRGRIIRKPGYTTLGQLANGTPVMGLKTLSGFLNDIQTLVAFDTTQAYEWNGTSFVALPSFMPVVWSGTNYQFFWTINYAGAFWATNGKEGLNGWALSNVGTPAFSAAAGTGTGSGGAQVNVNVPGNTAAVGDFVYLLNVTSTSPTGAVLNNLIFATVIAIDVG